MKSRIHMLPGLLLGLLLVCQPKADGQSLWLLAASDDTINYSDPAYGFELEVPADWTYNRARFQQFENSIGLMRGRSPDGRKGLQVLAFHIQPKLQGGGGSKSRAMHMPTFEEWMVDFGQDVGLSANAERLEWKNWRSWSRKGGILTYEASIGTARTRTHCLCVPFDQSIVWVLVYSGTVADDDDEKALKREFDRIVKSLKIHYDPEDVEQLASAFERGRKLVVRLRKQANEVRLDDTEYYYDIILGKEPIGYLSRQASREDYDFSSSGARYPDVREGLRVRERSWRFARDGTVRYTRLDMFTSFDMQNELIENQLTQVPAPDVQPQELYVKTDRVIRKEDVLFSSFTTSLDTSLPNPSPPFEVGPAYLDMSWTRVLPGLLFTAPPEPHAFAVYSTETRAISSLIIKYLGERNLPDGGGQAYAFEVREGLINKPAMMYVDQYGNLIYLKAGDLVIKRSTRDEIERMYGPRRDDARRRFRIPME